VWFTPYLYFNQWARCRAWTNGLVSLRPSEIGLRPDPLETYCFVCTKPIFCTSGASPICETEGLKGAPFGAHGLRKTSPKRRMYCALRSDKIQKAGDMLKVGFTLRTLCRSVCGAQSHIGLRPQVGEANVLGTFGAIFAERPSFAGRGPFGATQGAHARSMMTMRARTSYIFLIQNNISFVLSLLLHARSAKKSLLYIVGRASRGQVGEHSDTANPKSFKLGFAKRTEAVSKRSRLKRAPFCAPSHAPDAMPQCGPFGATPRTFCGPSYVTFKTSRINKS